MEQRLVLAFVLSAIVMIGSQLLLSPAPAPGPQHTNQTGQASDGSPTVETEAPDLGSLGLAVCYIGV